MPDYRRLYVSGGQYFFTLVTEGRRPILKDETARESLRIAIERCRAKLPIEMTAIVLLPDHLHMMWTMPVGDSDFSNRMQRIKAIFSREWLSRGGTAGLVSEYGQRYGHKGIWQRRFWEHFIRDTTDFENHYQYIHYNPVKHGYVKNVSDWPWSSFHLAVKKGYYSQNWGCADDSLPVKYTDLDLE